MSGATDAGAGGPGAEGRSPSKPTTAPEGARGATGDRKTMAMGTRQPQPKPQSGPQPQSGPGQSSSGQPGTGQSSSGQSAAGAAQTGQSAVGSARTGQSAAGRPASGQAGYGKPQQPPGQPYHPPHAYAAPAAGARAGAPGSGAQQGSRLPRTGARTVPRTRKARLRVAKADPWSVMKVSFLLSIALGICTIVAVAVLWMVMDAMGVFSTVGGTISEATGSDGTGGFDLESFLSLPRVTLFTSVIAVIDVVLATALATLGAFIYNLSAGVVGGVELTLAEDE